MGLLCACVRRQLAALGRVFKSSAPVRLTEEDTEYNIFCVKHVFEEHIVFQFDCTNTISEQVCGSVCASAWVSTPPFPPPLACPRRSALLLLQLRLLLTDCMGNIPAAQQQQQQTKK